MERRRHEVKTRRVATRIPVTPITAEVMFSFVLTPSTLEPRYNMGFPSRVAAMLPRVEKPAALIYNGKKWSMVFKGHYSIKKFDYPGWRTFASDNCLKVGDACVFELLDERKLEFKVQILDGQLPPDFFDEPKKEAGNVNADHERKKNKNGKASTSFGRVE